MDRRLVALGLAAALAGLAPAALAQSPAPRAYAPDNLRTLSRPDQERVIRLEYSEQSGGRAIPADQLRFYLDQVNRSNWTFSRIKADIAQSLRGTGPRPPAVLPPGPGGGAHVLRCESADGRYRLCRAGFPVGQARLVRQLSRGECRQGRTWGRQADGVWVDGGCRGEFEVGPGASGPGSGGYTVSCSSASGRTTTCAWDARQGMPQLRRQLSSAPCTFGRTWGYRPGRIWVGGGCRALFGP